MRGLCLRSFDFVKLDVRVADANTTSSGLRSANATTSVLDTDKSGASLDFAILPEETSVSVRVLVDRAVVEAFEAGGVPAIFAGGVPAYVESNSIWNPRVE